jgi:hypothetical protein
MNEKYATCAVSATLHSERAYYAFAEGRTIMFGVGTSASDGPVAVATHLRIRKRVDADCGRAVGGCLWVVVDPLPRNINGALSSQQRRRILSVL